ncbi:MAG: DUF1080 domain-containing protein [Planctomycetia bacterium]|nr:DUF1080 domain-containing protein [Planctomycetia bacterium]
MATIRTLLRFVNRILSCSVAIALAGCSSSAPVFEAPKSQQNEIANAQPATASWSPWQKEELTVDEFSPEEGFRELSFSDFEPFFSKPPKAEALPTWIAVGKAIVCTGKPKGYLYSKHKFKDFTLRLELRFAPAETSEANDSKPFDPNSGVMLYIAEPHKQWPKSLEVQGRFSELATIKANGGATKVEPVDDATVRESARKPTGEWNALEILSKAGSLTVLLNGQKICESQPSDVSEGSIGLQSEDFEVHFRRLRIHAE